MKKIITLLSFILILWGANFYYNKLTDGFSIREIGGAIPFCTAYETPENENSFRPILNQPFHYIGKGTQSYAFESEDGKYVLKFFKQKHLRTYSHLRKFPMPAFCKEILERKIARREERAQKLFSSCKLCFDAMKEQTGLCMLHLNCQKNSKCKTTLIDRLGFKFEIPIDQYQFMLQEKGVDLNDSFKALVAQKNEVEIKESVKKIAALLEMRGKLGISDEDVAFVQNIAFTPAGEPFFIDVGRFYRDEKAKYKESIQEDIRKRFGSFRAWSEEKMPALTCIIEEVAREYQ